MLTLVSEPNKPSLANLSCLICFNLACYLVELDIISKEIKDVIKEISLSNSNIKKPLPN
jgi:hypothetical protein